MKVCIRRRDVHCSDGIPYDRLARHTEQPRPAISKRRRLLFAEVSLAVSLLPTGAACASTRAQPARISSPTVLAPADVPAVTLLQTTDPAAATTTPTPVDTANYAATPSAEEIKRELSKTVEARNARHHFKAEGPTVSTSDGSGGQLTAIAAVRESSSDDSGELVFFWHGETLLGWDSLYESNRLILKVAGPGKFAVTYASDDAKHGHEPVVITYTWNGSRLVPDASPPPSKDPVAVELEADSR